MAESSYLKLREVAEHMHVSVSTIKRWQRDLDFPMPLNLGNEKLKTRPMFSREDVDAWAQRNTKIGR